MENDKSVTAVEWLVEQLKPSIALQQKYIDELKEKAKEMEKRQIQISYSEKEIFEIVNNFCFDWNYNYKGELSQKEYLIEWFKNFKSKSNIKKEPNSFTKEDVRQAWVDSERNMRATFSSSTYKETAFEQWLENRIKSNQ